MFLWKKNRIQLFSVYTSNFHFMTWQLMNIWKIEIVDGKTWRKHLKVASEMLNVTQIGGMTLLYICQVLVLITFKFPILTSLVFNHSIWFVFNFKLAIPTISHIAYGFVHTYIGRYEWIETEKCTHLLRKLYLSHR